MPPAGKNLPQAAYQARALGCETCPRLFVDHPISDQTSAQLHAKADAAIAGIILALTSDAATSGETLAKTSDCASAPSVACAT